MRVLIADDDKCVGTSLAGLVWHCEHEVVGVVRSGVEAIQAYSTHRPDVVILDYRMPKLNGATACRNILARHPDARVILISGLRDVDELVDAGAAVVLTKPIPLGRLAEALHTVGRRRSIDSKEETCRC